MRHSGLFLGVVVWVWATSNQDIGLLGRVCVPKARTTALPTALPCSALQEQPGQKGKGPRGHWVPGSGALVGGEPVMLFCMWQRQNTGTDHVCDGQTRCQRERQQWDPQCVWTRQRYTLVLVTFNTFLLLTTILLNAPSYAQTRCLTTGMPAGSVTEPAACKEPGPWPRACVSTAVTLRSPVVSRTPAWASKAEARMATRSGCGGISV